MRKVLSFLLISLFLISFVSAGVITVEPNIFTLDAMGEFEGDITLIRE